MDCVPWALLEEQVPQDRRWLARRSRFGMLVRQHDSFDSMVSGLWR